MKNHLILGDWNALCDSCGRKFKASSLKKRWDGLIVCKEDWEQRHPQDLLRVQREQISVPWARPYPAQDTFLPWNYTDTEKDALGINEAIAKNILKRFGYMNDSSALGNFALNTAVLNFNGSSSASTEAITFSETLLVSLARFLTDNLSLAESFAKSTTKRISETVSIAESLYFAEQEHSVDTLSLAETRISSVIKVLSDSLSITESTTYKLSTATALNGAALDTKPLG
jgi:hypothetical protein